MTSRTILRGAILAAALGAAIPSHADSFTSSASSAGSASSGSVSDSLQGSSNSSSGDKDKRRADGNYQIIDIEQTPGRAGSTRIAMQAGDPQQRIVLDLPRAVFDKQGLGRGDLVHAQNRSYGIEFARADTREPFFLVLEDALYKELAARKVTL
jgi:type IV secretory pathway TrbL component